MFGAAIFASRNTRKSRLLNRAGTKSNIYIWNYSLYILQNSDPFVLLRCHTKQKGRLSLSREKPNLNFSLKHGSFPSLILPSPISHTNLTTYNTWVFDKPLALPNSKAFIRIHFLAQFFSTSIHSCALHLCFFTQTVCNTLSNHNSVLHFKAMLATTWWKSPGLLSSACRCLSYFAYSISIIIDTPVLWTFNTSPTKN